MSFVNDNSNPMQVVFHALYIQDNQIFVDSRTHRKNFEKLNIKKVDFSEKSYIIDLQCKFL